MCLSCKGPFELYVVCTLQNIVNGAPKCFFFNFLLDQSIVNLLETTAGKQFKLVEFLNKAQ